MELRGNTLVLSPTEIDWMFGSHGFTPPPVEGEPEIDWESLKEPLMAIQATRGNANRRLLGAEPVPTTVNLGDYEQARGVPRALAVLARRAFEQERDRKIVFRPERHAGVIARVGSLASDLLAITESPRKVVLSVHCASFEELRQASEQTVAQQPQDPSI